MYGNLRPKWLRTRLETNMQPISILNSYNFSFFVCTKLHYIFTQTIFQIQICIGLSWTENKRSKHLLIFIKKVEKTNSLWQNATTYDDLVISTTIEQLYLISIDVRYVYIFIITNLVKNFNCYHFRKKGNCVFT